MIHISLKAIKETAKHRPPEYLEDLVEAGHLAGEYLLMDQNDYIRLKDKYSPGIMGLGDAVAKVAKPIAGLTDRILGTNLRNCRSCTERQQAWNKAVPFKA